MYLNDAGAWFVQFRDTVRAGRWTVALGLALLQGVRDVNKLTDMLFFARYPGREGQRLTPVEQKMWLRIRDHVVKPGLSGRRVALTTASSPTKKSRPANRGKPTSSTTNTLRMPIVVNIIEKTGARCDIDVWSVDNARFVVDQAKKAMKDLFDIELIVEERRLNCVKSAVIPDSGLESRPIALWEKASLDSNPSRRKIHIYFVKSIERDPKHYQELDPAAMTDRRGHMIAVQRMTSPTVLLAHELGHSLGLGDEIGTRGLMSERPIDWIDPLKREEARINGLNSGRLLEP